jgi:hypothetical protein
MRPFTNASALKFPFEPAAIKAAASGLVALACLSAATFIAAHHPLWPAVALLGVALASFLEWRRPGSWLFVVPASLPLLNFSPWTGWLIFEEFDLLVLAMFAAGYCHLGARALRRGGGSSRPFVLSVWHPPILVFGVLSLVALWVGVRDAGGWSFSWFQGYTEPLNAVRIAKSSLLAALALPLIARQLRAAPRRAAVLFCRGMTSGAAVVALAVLWERVAYPGLLNISADYRTTALFWEMHVGGAAIDAYLALATPFVAWALSSARSVPRWIMAALLALAIGYAGLSTFSRGVYLSMAGPLVLLCALLVHRRSDLDARERWLQLTRLAVAAASATAFLAGAVSALGDLGLLLALLLAGASIVTLKLRRPCLLTWRTLGNFLLFLALMAEVVAVMGAGSFMRDRLDAADRDFARRLEHWSRALDLLRKPADWWVGRGLGRFPASYAREIPNGQFPGDVRIHRVADGASFATLSGPQTSVLGGRYGLSQRVSREKAYRLRMDVRSSMPVRLYVRVCERHLLYDGQCQIAFVRAGAMSTGWSHIETALRGPSLLNQQWFADRQVTFELAAVAAGSHVDLRYVVLSGPDVSDLLANGDFSNGLAHWQPVASGYFLPWHVDNLYLEVLIERGLPALLAFVMLAILALSRQMTAKSTSPVAPYFAASLFGILLLGLVSSVFDVPRVAYLFQLLVLFSLMATERHFASPGDVSSSNSQRP